MVKLELSEWLKPADVVGDTAIVFLDEGVLSVSDFEGVTRPSFEISVSLGVDKSRKWNMNLTSQRVVASLFGDDTSLWVGQKVVLFLADQNVQGKMKKVIYVRD